MIFSGDHSKLYQGLFNRLSKTEKIEVLEYISSKKHELTLEEELK